MFNLSAVKLEHLKRDYAQTNRIFLNVRIYFKSFELLMFNVFEGSKASTIHP